MRSNWQFFNDDSLRFTCYKNVQLKILLILNLVEILQYRLHTKLLNTRLNTVMKKEENKRTKNFIQIKWATFQFCQSLRSKKGTDLKAKC